MDLETEGWRTQMKYDGNLDINHISERENDLWVVKQMLL